MLKKTCSVFCYVIGSLSALTIPNVQAMDTGLASYYSDRFQGHRTASGAKYDRNKLTAAHRTLPIGSQIEVTNLKNQSSVVVTITDRGPYGGHRKLDLSYAAAKEIGLLAMGVAPVSYELVTSDKKDNDFEQVIPREYTPGVLEVAKSEEEQIEAEEELVSSESAPPSVTKASEEQKNTSTPHAHKAKKVALSEKKTPSHKKETSPNKGKKHSASSQSEKKAKLKQSSQTTHGNKNKHTKAKKESNPKKSTHKS